MDIADTTADIIIVGDDVESCLTAVSAARLLGKDGRVVLLRLQQADDTAEAMLGGLCTRAALSYMDITPEWVAPLFGEFLQRAGVVRVALSATKAHQTLQAMLAEANVTVRHASHYIEAEKTDDDQWQLTDTTRNIALTCQVLIDTTPDGHFGWLCGPAINGLGGILGQAWPNTLGVSPVFHTTGVGRDELIRFEESLRQRPETAALIAAGLPWRSADEQAELLTRPVFSPDDMDYIDILNPVIGLWFHRWCGYLPDTYPTAPVKVDGFNISRLADDTLGWNGLVAMVDNIDAQLALSRGSAPYPPQIIDAAEKFAGFLIEEGGFTQAKLTLPERLYVRQTRQHHMRRMLSTVDLLQGGVPPEEAIGTFSYWVDLRGVSLQQAWPNEPVLPKPTFNVGLQAHLSPKADNMALVSRSAGFGPIAQGACRIVQHLAQVGEAMGILAALAVQQQQSLASTPISWVQQQLEQRYQRWQQRSLPIEGKTTWEKDESLAHPALQREVVLLKNGQPNGD